jgi:hypothetical protein
MQTPTESATLLVVNLAEKNDSSRPSEKFCALYHYTYFDTHEFEYPLNEIHYVRDCRNLTAKTLVESESALFLDISDQKCNFQELSNQVQFNNVSFSLIGTNDFMVFNFSVLVN